jgi:hypothetical protein
MVLVVVSLASLITLFLVMVYSYPTSSTQPDWMSAMWSHMGGMMGGAGHSTDPYLGYFGLLFTVLIGVIIVSVAGLVYFLLFPELKTVSSNNQKKVAERPEKSIAIESIRRTLTVDESKILQVLENHDGKYLQKYLRKEAGLSRLKTHRILARFAERGLVTLEKVGNTNEVNLSNWLKKNKIS